MNIKPIITNNVIIPIKIFKKSIANLKAININGKHIIAIKKYFKYFFIILPFIFNI